MSHPLRCATDRSRYEVPKIKGSRFIGTVAPVRAPADVDACLANVSAELPGATHHCWAYRLGRDGSIVRAHDDGEPGGTAGRPILQQLVVRGLTNTLVVVTRFFGGTKLGAGGLVRAYAQAAGAALDRVALRDLIPLQVLTFTFAYDASGAVRAVLAAHALEPVQSTFGSEVTLVLHLPEASAAQIGQELLDCTAGRGRLERAPAPDL